MKQTRVQPLTIKGNNITSLRRKMYNMFAELVPSSQYRFHSNGNVRYNTLPFYQCGGNNHAGRTYISKEMRSFTRDEATALEIIAQTFKDEGVELYKRAGVVKGLRLKYKQRSKNEAKPAYIVPANAYKTEDNIDSVQTEMPLVSLEFDHTDMFVVVKNDNKIHLILSRKEIEKSIIEDNRFLSNVSIFSIGEQIKPVVTTSVKF